MACGLGVPAGALPATAPRGPGAPMVILPAAPTAYAAGVPPHYHRRGRITPRCSAISAPAGTAPLLPSMLHDPKAAFRCPGRGGRADNHLSPYHGRHPSRRPLLRPAGPDEHRCRSYGFRPWLPAAGTTRDWVRGRHTRCALAGGTGSGGYVGPRQRAICTHGRAGALGGRAGYSSLAPRTRCVPGLR